MKTLCKIFLVAIALLLPHVIHGKDTTTKGKQTFSIGDKTFLLGGKPFMVKAAELHYPRIPRQYWEHRIKMCKALGMNTICLYVFWNIHEQREGVFDFTDNNDVAAFCRLAQKHGMYVIVRPGPYVCAEWEMGGLPWWLLKKLDIILRNNHPYYLELDKMARLAESHPSLCSLYTDITEEPLIAGKFLVYSGPTVLLMMHQKEVYRGSGFIDLDELEHKIMQYTELSCGL